MGRQIQKQGRGNDAYQHRAPALQQGARAGGGNPVFSRLAWETLSFIDLHGANGGPSIFKQSLDQLKNRSGGLGLAIFPPRHRGLIHPQRVREKRLVHLQRAQGLNDDVRTSVYVRHAF
ncbi:hypothetical protein SAMN03159448_00163 [Sinorhizobium sp. NFACC03]|nr:hypothetical protein SAMN03159448_00163 [Sinorhizobium sp. NFACC03]